MTAALACQKTSQHQTSTTLFRACGWDRETSPLSRSPVCSPTSTPKPRAEGRWLPVALCRAGLGSRLGRCWALPTGEQHPRRQPRPSPSAPATKPAETLGFRRFSFFMCCMVLWFTLVQTPGFPIRFYPFSTVSTLSSTQNAPDFSYFRLKSGAFRCFYPLLTCKIFGSVFVRIAIHWFQDKIICDSSQPRGVFFKVVQLCDLAGAVAQQVSHLSRGKRFDTAILLFYPVHQAGCECVSQRVQAFFLYPSLCK